MFISQFDLHPGGSNLHPLDAIMLQTAVQRDWIQAREMQVGSKFETLSSWEQVLEK
ncbi:hypothetical protein M758_12G048300 [Ceratodon purpureus]|uniref:Uncharacterized protein n=1 Tax=Ceratodon purpureus TaxID=3225 RepID=A0A8T0G605_CERPU|nr:hypothetical protein KC19_12G045700 [Ceratodon purpureus]KAG0598129.1 hypothetical protein M758_12G048300 [Ceratodon purpureus]